MRAVSVIEIIGEGSQLRSHSLHAARKRRLQLSVRRSTGHNYIGTGTCCSTHSLRRGRRGTGPSPAWGADLAQVRQTVIQMSAATSGVEGRPRVRERGRGRLGGPRRALELQRSRASSAWRNLTQATRGARKAGPAHSQCRPAARVEMGRVMPGLSRRTNNPVLISESPASVRRRSLRTRSSDRAATCPDVRISRF